MRSCSKEYLACNIPHYITKLDYNTNFGILVVSLRVSIHQCNQDEGRRKVRARFDLIDEELDFTAKREIINLLDVRIKLAVL